MEGKKILVIDSETLRGQKFALAFQNIGGEVFFSDCTSAVSLSTGKKIQDKKNVPNFDLVFTHHSEVDCMGEIPCEKIVGYSGGSRPPDWLEIEKRDKTKKYWWIEARYIASFNDALTEKECNSFLEWLEDSSKIPALLLPEITPDTLHALYILCQGYLIAQLDPQTNEPEICLTTGEREFLRNVLREIQWTGLYPHAFAQADEREKIRARVKSSEWWGENFHNTAALLSTIHRECSDAGIDCTHFTIDPVEKLVRMISRKQPVEDCIVVAEAFFSIHAMLKKNMPIAYVESGATIEA
jgi:hypothetical protein